MKQFWKKTLWRFDRAYSANSALKPALWVAGSLLLFVLLFWLIGLLWYLTPYGYNKPYGTPRIVETLSLLLSPGNFPRASVLPYLFQAVVSLFGAVFFTAFLIATFNRVLVNRVDNYLNGYSRYYFENHILILGGGSQIPSIINSIASKQEYQGKDVVILSARNTQAVKEQILPLLTPDAQKMVLTFYFGSYGMESDLSSCQVENASHIFILGEDDSLGLDSLNVECWKRVRGLRSNAASVAQCFLFLCCQTTTHLFHMLPQESHTSMETTLINQYEAVAQQLLVGENPQLIPFTLDRGLITPDADRYVHFVVVGMTPMGYALATTAAHLCHFPNFNEAASRPIRTRITFIDPSADSLMNQFMSNYSGLFSLSHSILRLDDKSWMQGKPDSRYGDFLDVEWEFVKGSVDEEWVRNQLVGYVNDPHQVLSLAFCNLSPEVNIAHAFHLPPQFYPLNEDGGGSLSPALYVYQPSSMALVDAARMEIPKYSHIVPFSMSVGSIDPLLTHRIAAAKRFNYLYQKVSSGKEFTAMPTEVSVLDEMWRQLSFAEKMSNIYAANAACVMMRNMGIDVHTGMQPVNDPVQVERLAKVEHARWNMEKLLVGFDAMPAAERRQLNTDLSSDDPDIRQEARMKSNRSKNQQFVLKDISPYLELPEDAKEFDTIIMRNLPVTLLPYIFNTSASAI